MIRPSIVGQIPPRRVPIYIKAGLLKQLDRCLFAPQRGCPLELVTDRTVDSLYASRVVASLCRGKWHVHKTVLRNGEASKNASTVHALHEGWFQRRRGRTTRVVALGGGAVTDTVGYAAATFMRGVPLWLIPTTIIGQVDAAIGGKVGINDHRGKNLIGCFYHPTGIIVDPETLVTLPLRERRSGLAEVVKYGVIGDLELFARCESELTSWLAGSSSLPLEVLRRCIRAKTEIVAADETDIGLRHILNFGHTLGHALEKWGRYRRFRHGEAIALGMVGAACIASLRGMFSHRQMDRLAGLCGSLHGQTRAVEVTETELRTHLSFDKKRRLGRHVWVLPRAIGRVAVYDDITAREIHEAIRFLRDWVKR